MPPSYPSAVSACTWAKGRAAWATWNAHVRDQCFARRAPPQLRRRRGGGLLRNAYHPHHAHPGMHGMEKPPYIARKGKMSSQRNTGTKTLTIATTRTNWLGNQCDWAGRMRSPIHTTLSLSRWPHACFRAHARKLPPFLKCVRWEDIFGFPIYKGLFPPTGTGRIMWSRHCFRSWDGGAVVLQRWVQAQTASAEWTRAAHFGQGDTPNGMRYRIYVLSTSTVLPVGELTKQPDSPQESPAITVTLKK